MKIVQVLETLSFGDAVSNDALAMKDVIASLGYETEIYAVNIHPKCVALCKPFAKLPELGASDIVIYHNSIGSEISFLLPKLSAKKVMVYHNMTPPQFFAPYQRKTTMLLEYGIEGTRFLADKIDCCLADSEFNRIDLQAMHYQCPIDVLPILIPFADYQKAPSKKILQRYNDGVHNLVFTGRIAPNKRQEDIIAAFDCYQKLFNEQARLFLVGSYEKNNGYYLRLKEYIKQLGTKQVYFTGHIPFDEILAYYRLADLFVCMSEHEGFCVPLVEAMYFDVPILAYASTAVPFTLGGSGFLLTQKDPVLWAHCIQRLLKDKELRRQILSGQQKRLKDFQYDQVRTQFVTYLQAFLKQS